MEDYKKIQQKFKLMDDYILVHSKGEEKIKTIAIPKTGSYAQRREWIDRINIVVAIGNDVKKIGIGDNILLNPHTKIRRIDEITKIISELLNKSFVIKFKDKSGKEIGGEQEIEKYYIVKEEDVICSIL